MLNDLLKEKLIKSDSLEEVKECLSDRPDLDAERIWQEIEKHRSWKNEKLDLDEHDAVSGGADRDWVKDGCAATCEASSWCWSNDLCAIWDAPTIISGPNAQMGNRISLKKQPIVASAAVMCTIITMGKTIEPSHQK